MKYVIMVVLVVSSCVLLLAQDKDTAQVNPAFEDVTEKAGIKLGNGQARHVAWGDYDNDGFDDLLLNGSRLFKNNKDGVFTDTTQKAKITEPAGGGIWGDYDNDGHLDIFAYDYNKYILWHNNKDGTFTSVAKEAGLGINPYPTQAAAWVDINNDAYLDLYVVNYEWNDKELISVGAPDVLWLNNKNGTFDNVSLQSGITKSEPPKCGYGVAPADFNNDGFADIYVTNYRLQPNYLWKNDGKGFFIDVAREARVQDKESKVDDNGGVFLSYGHSIGACWGDINNDGLLDLFCANLAHGGRFLEFSDISALYINQGAPKWDFINIQKESGIPYAETHSEPSFGDYDKDGFLDLYLSICYKDRYVLFYRNQGNCTFKDMTKEAGISQQDGWSAAWCDYDNDGNLDLAVGGGWESALKLYRNKGNKNAYLKVKVAGKDCNKSGIGTKIKVTAGKLVQAREIFNCHGLASQDSMSAFFGFGDYKGKVEVEVKFPCGKVKTLKAQDLNKIITVNE